MRQSGDGRSTVFPWSDASTPLSGQSAYAVGDVVYSGQSRGSVVSLDAEHATISVVWEDGDGGAIIYPTDATYLRRKYPWEL